MSGLFVCGINIGTRKSSCVYEKNGKQTILLTDNGNNSIYSIICFKSSDKILIGDTAENIMGKYCNTTVYDVKRLLGKTIDDPRVSDDKNHLIYQVEGDEYGNVVINLTVDNKTMKYTPEKMTSLIMNKLCENVKGCKQKYAVLAVPSCFNERQRRATIEAGQLSGFYVLGLINEPTAISIVYRNKYLLQGGEGRERGIFNIKKTILVYDFGGGMFDCSIIEVESDKIKVLASGGDDHLGGEDLTNNLLQYFVNKIKENSGFDISTDKRVIMKLKKACETAKIELCYCEETNVYCKFLEDNGIENTITLNEFLEINKEIFNRTMEIVRNVLYKARILNDLIDEIVLVGGSSRIPKVETLLKCEFPCKKINYILNSEETIAMGCSILASDLIKGIRPLIIDENNYYLNTITPSIPPIPSLIPMTGPDRPSPNPTNPTPYPDNPSPKVLKKFDEIIMRSEEDENDIDGKEVQTYLH